MMTVTADMYTPENLTAFLAAQGVDEETLKGATFEVSSVFNDECEMCTGEVTMDDYYAALDHFGPEGMGPSDFCMVGYSFIHIYHGETMTYFTVLSNFDEWALANVS
jgi:hypothetical protein